MSFLKKRAYFPAAACFLAGILCFILNWIMIFATGSFTEISGIWVLMDQILFYGMAIFLFLGLFLWRKASKEEKYFLLWKEQSAEAEGVVEFHKALEQKGIEALWKGKSWEIQGKFPTSTEQEQPFRLIIDCDAEEALPKTVSLYYNPSDPLIYVTQYRDEKGILFQVGSAKKALKDSGLSTKMKRRFML